MSRIEQLNMGVLNIKESQMVAEESQTTLENPWKLWKMGKNGRIWQIRIECPIKANWMGRAWLFGRHPTASIPLTSRMLRMATISLSSLSFTYQFIAHIHIEVGYYSFSIESSNP